MRCVSATAASRRGSASSCCCRSPRSCTRRPRACSPAWRSPPPAGGGRSPARSPVGRLSGGRLLAVAFPVASVVWALLRLYRDPPVFAFDPFGGYFPGPIYDEALRPPLTLLVFRIVNLVWIATAVAIAAAAVGRGWNPRRWRLRAGAVAAPLLVASVVLYAMGGTLQFR